MKKISIKQVEIAYYDSCHGSGEPCLTLLLVHGFPLSHAMWKCVISCLEKHERFHTGRLRIIAPDLPGYGASVCDNPPKNLAEYADNLAQLLDALNVEEPIVYVGFSMGGYVFWPFLQKYASRLKGVALVDTRAADDSEEGRATRQKMAANVEEWGAQRVAQLMRPNLFLDNQTESDAVTETLHVIASTEPKTIAASQIAMANRPDSTALLPEISVPTQVIVGESDSISTAEEMESIAQSIPCAELSIIEKAGHMTPVEQPEEVGKAILKLIARID